MKLAVKYYWKYWKARNSRRFCIAVRSKFLLEWFDNKITATDNLTHPEVSKYINIGAEKIRNSSNDSIQK